MRGGARPNSGPKKGSKYRFDRELAARLETSGAVTPLDTLLAMMNDQNLDVMVRLRAATAAAPYVHKKKPVALEVAGRFEFLSPEEREQRRQLLLEEIRARAVRPPSDGEATNN